MPRLSVDLGGSGDPIDDMRAIRNCYSTIAEAMLEGAAVQPDNLAELLFLLETQQDQSISNLEYKESATTESVEKELINIIQKFSNLANDKAFTKYTANWLDDSGQPIESLGIGELLSSIELYREHYDREASNE